MKIVCVGRNYKAHAEELGNNVPTEPVIFFKPESAIIASTSLSIPQGVGTIHYEAELVFKISRSIPVNTRIDDIGEVCSEITLGIDFTARELQQKLKSKGLPWELSKSFDQSAAIGDWISWKSLGLGHLEFDLWKNNECVQQGNSSNMLFTPTEIVNYCTQFFSFCEGDLLFTGTPEGVGPIQSGDVLEGFIEAQKLLSLVVL